MNKVVLVTGSSQGLGKNIILKYAKEGYDVIINYNHSKQEALELEKFITNNYKVKSLVVKCDISDSLEVNKMMEIIKKHFKKIDVLVNNAAVEINSLFFVKDYDSFEAVLKVNVIGTYLVTKYVSALMLENKNGKIINISSNNALNKYDPTTMEYDASKSAIISMTHNMALALAPYINVNCICPGFIKTDKIMELDKQLDYKFIESQSKRILLNRFASVEDISNLVYFLSSDEASYINDAVIKIDGGSYND